MCSAVFVFPRRTGWGTLRGPQIMIFLFSRRKIHRGTLSYFSSLAEERASRTELCSFDTGAKRSWFIWMNKNVISRRMLWCLEVDEQSVSVCPVLANRWDREAQTGAANFYTKMYRNWVLRAESIFFSPLLPGEGRFVALKWYNTLYCFIDMVKYDLQTLLDWYD